jgi:deoxyribose-phosphate aldolase
MSEFDEVFSRFDLNVHEDEVIRETAGLVAKWKENHSPEVLKVIYSCIDLSSLNTGDSKESIWKLVEKVNDWDGSRSDMDNVAAICVYPNFVQTVKDSLTADVRIASVAGGFPSSQTFIEVKIAEVSLAVSDGADEIDIVLNGGNFFDEDFQSVAEEIGEIKEACRDARLKVILETGLLATPSNIKKAAVLSMYSGADFIKTSTGKVYPGATPEAVYVICQTIKEYDQLHNKKVGIKISGGVRTIEDALIYYTLVKEILGTAWLTPEYFRIGASNLDSEILKVL